MSQVVIIVRSELFGLLLRATLALACAVVLPAGGAEAPATTPGLLVSYHVAAAERPALRRALRTDMRARLQRLKDEGVLESYRLLFSRHADGEQWDAMVLVSLNGPVQQARQREIADSMAAATDPSVPALRPVVNAVPVDLMRNDAAPALPSNPVVLVIPYQTLVPALDYLDYADGYVIPQFEGWMREGVLSRFAIYASKDAASRGWSHTILLDYRGEEALAARAAVVARVRAQLKEQPAWRALSESKVKVREERQAVVADDITDGDGPP